MAAALASALHWLLRGAAGAGTHQQSTIATGPRRPTSLARAPPPCCAGWTWRACSWASTTSWWSCWAAGRPFPSPTRAAPARWWAALNRTAGALWEEAVMALWGRPPDWQPPCSLSKAPLRQATHRPTRPTAGRPGAGAAVGAGARGHHRRQRAGHLWGQAGLRRRRGVAPAAGGGGGSSTVAGGEFCTQGVIELLCKGAAGLLRATQTRNMHAAPAAGGGSPGCGRLALQCHNN